MRGDRAATMSRKISNNNVKCMTLRVASIARHRNLKKRTTGVIGVEEVDWGIAAVRRKVGRPYSPGVNGSWLIETPSRHGSSEDGNVACQDSLCSESSRMQTDAASSRLLVQPPYVRR